MIIAGIYDPQGNVKKEFASKLSELITTESKIDCAEMDRDFLYIIAGNNQNKDQCVIHAGNHIAVGKIFNNESYQPLTEDDLGPIKSHKEFVDKFWGAYVVVSFDEQNKKIEILRDTLGSVSLFYHKLPGGVLLFSSKLSVIVDVLGGKRSLSHDYLNTYISLGTVQTRLTPFADIFSVFTGCQLCVAPSGINEKLVFDPTEYVKTDMSMPEIQEEIVERLKKVLHAWTHDSDGILLDFSGGTDSSGILFCLKELQCEGQDVKGINMFNSNVRSSDERVYARAIAKEADADLIEFDSMENLGFDPVNQLPVRPNYPSTSYTVVKAEQDMIKFTTPYKNPCFVSGHGGDHIFLCPPPIESLSDYVIECGFKGFGDEIRELGMMFRRPILPLLRDTIKGFGSYYLPFNYKPSVLQHAQRADWFSEKVYKHSKKTDFHPLYSHPNFMKLVPGKASQIDIVYHGFATIVDDVRSYHGFPVFYPLFCQPMLELAFAIPTYKTYKNGFNRYPFRKAMENYYGTKNLWRRDKGETSGVFQLGLKKNADIVMGLCAEGYCAQHGIVNKELIHAHLNKVMNGSTDMQWPLTHVMTLEMFIKCWSQ